MYAFRHPDGRFYVGSSKRMQERRKEHIKRARNGSKNFFHRHLALGGFIYGVIEYCTKDARLAREAYWISELRAETDGFNTQADPTKGPGYEISDATRRRMRKSQKITQGAPDARALRSERAKSQWEDPEMRATIIACVKARVSTPKARAAQSALAKAQWADPKYRAWQSAQARTRMLLPEVRAANSARQKARAIPPSERAANSARVKLRYSNPKARDEQSDRMRAFYAENPDRCIAVGQFTKSWEPIREFKSISEAARETGLFSTAIWACCSGVNKSTGGFCWRRI